MNNQKIVLYLGLVIVVFGLGVYLFSNGSDGRKMVAEPTPAMEVTPEEGLPMEREPSEESAMISVTPTDAGGAINTESEKMIAGSESRYLVHSGETIASSSESRRVLFFFANWCPTCKPADDDFSKNSAMIPEGVAVIRVNYNDTETDQAEKDLAKQYGVTYQHTFIQIDKDGKVVTKWNGGGTKELIANLK